jgi:hypothetical protein
MVVDPSAYRTRYWHWLLAQPLEKGPSCLQAGELQEKVADVEDLAGSYRVSA